MDALMIPIVPSPKAMMAVEVQTPAGKKTGANFADYMEKKLVAKGRGQGNLFGLATEKATSVSAALKASPPVLAQQEGTAGTATVAALLGQFVQYLQKSAEEQELGPGEWSFPAPAPELLQKIASDAGMNEGHLSALLGKMKSQDGRLSVVEFLDSFARHFQSLQDEVPVTAPETDLPLLQILFERLGVPVSEVSRISKAAVRGDNTFDLQKVADLLQGLSGERITDLTAVEAGQLQELLAEAGVSGQLQRTLLPERLPVIEGLVESGPPVTLTLDRLKNMLAQGVREVKANRLQAEPLSFLADLKEVLARSGFTTNGPRLSSAVQGTVVAVFEKLMESVAPARVRESRDLAAAEPVMEKKDLGFWQGNIAEEKEVQTPAGGLEIDRSLLHRLLARLGVPESEVSRLSEVAVQGEDNTLDLQKVANLLQGAMEERITDLGTEVGRISKAAVWGDNTLDLQKVADLSQGRREEIITDLGTEVGRISDAAVRGDNTFALQKVTDLSQGRREEIITDLGTEVGRISDAAVGGDNTFALQKVADLLQVLTGERIIGRPAGEAAQLPQARLFEGLPVIEGLVESGPPVALVLDQLKNMLAQGVRAVEAGRLPTAPLAFLADLQEALAPSGFAASEPRQFSAVQGQLLAAFAGFLENVDLARVRVSRGSGVAEPALAKKDFLLWPKNAGEKEALISGKMLFAEGRGFLRAEAPVLPQGEAAAAVSVADQAGRPVMSISSPPSQELRQDSALAEVFVDKAELSSLPDFMPFRVQTKLMPSGCKNGLESWQGKAPEQGEALLATATPLAEPLPVEGRDAPVLGVSAEKTGARGELFVENSGIFQNMTAAMARAEAAAPAAVANQAARPLAHIPHLSQGFEQQGFAQLSQGVLQGLRNQEHHLVLKLYPKELGEVKVEMTVRDNQVALSFAMENSRVKEALESNLGQFKENMEKQGFTLGECTVSLNRDNEGREAWQQFQPVSREKGTGRRRTTLADLPEDILYQRAQPGIGRESGVDLFA